MTKGVIPLSRFTAALGRPSGKKRVEQLIADPQAEAKVAELPAQELFLLITEVGLSDAQELFELATPEQVQSFFDLDVWRGDQLDQAAVVPWLEALLEAGPEALTKVWRALDQELTALLLQGWTRIYNLKEEEVPDDEEPPFIPTPDTFFLIKVTEDGDAKLVERIVDRLYRVDAELARHTLRSAQTENKSYLEEMSYRWRSGRMADLGYADPIEALEVYKPVDVSGVRLDEGGGERDPHSHASLPAPFVRAAVGPPFLGQVLGQLTDGDEARRIETQLLLVFNRILAADRVRPADLVEAGRVVARAAATLSVGLETVSRGDLALAQRALSEMSLVRLHRVGVSVLAKLAEAAAALTPQAARAGEPGTTVLQALAERRPVFPRVLDEPPGLGTRPVASRADVALVARALARLGAEIVLVRDLLRVDPVPLGLAVTLGDVGRTALLRRVLGRGEDFGFAPVTPGDVRAFVTRLRSGDLAAARDAALASISQKAEARNLPLPREWTEVASGWWGSLEDELKRLDPTPSSDDLGQAGPDPRFVGGLVFASDSRGESR